MADRTCIVAGAMLAIGIVLTALIVSGVLAFPGKTVQWEIPNGIPQGVSGAGEASPAQGTAFLSLNASPRRYSPFMSSTIGIGIEPVATGFDKNTVVFVWNTTYGRFADWNQSTYKVTECSRQCRNNGEKLYWTFYDMPGDDAVPVVITVTALDKKNGSTIAGSSLTLTWDRFDNRSGYTMAVVPEYP